jgi:hypothetical protein
MSTSELAARRREARCKARSLVLGATPEQIDAWRDRNESRANCTDRLLRLLAVCPFAALAYIGA